MTAPAPSPTTGPQTNYVCEVRRVPTPVCEPPYDDELDENPSPVGGVQGALALAFHLPSGLPATPKLRLVEEPPDPETDPAYFDPQATPADVLPDPRGFAGRLVQAMCEVMVAARPVAQLMRWTSEDVYRQLLRRVRVAGHETALMRRNTAPGRVRSVHVGEPRENVVEVCAVVQQRNRATAVALRLEGVDGRWQCTALQLG